MAGLSVMTVLATTIPLLKMAKAQADEDGFAEHTSEIKMSSRSSELNRFLVSVLKKYFDSIQYFSNFH